MASFDIGELSQKYEGYYYPLSQVLLGGQNPEEDKKIKVEIADIDVELTSEYKAGIASFNIYGLYEKETQSFDVKGAKKYILLGLDVQIYLGHGMEMTEVFRGFIARVDFQMGKNSFEPVVHITAMDVKGIMMANNSAKRLEANYYSDAIKEIFNQAPYQDLKNRSVVTDISVTDTPDKPQGGAGAGGNAPDIRIEMASESDYDFVIKAAKHFNYEFFSIGGEILFRKSKSNTEVMVEIEPSVAILDYDIGYDITGVVGEVVVRGLDVGKGSKIEVKKKNSNKLSLGGKAKPIISGQKYTVLDTAIETQQDADQRATYMLEDISYRLGSLNMTFYGMPEFVPGRFVKLKNFGDGLSNSFYITDVNHKYDKGGIYTTTIHGKASSIG